MCMMYGRHDLIRQRTVESQMILLVATMVCEFKGNWPWLAEAFTFLDVLSPIFVASRGPERGNIACLLSTQSIC